MRIGEKVAYLQGLAEGMELDREKKEGKLLSAILDVLGDVAEELRDLREGQEELSETLEAVSDDLADVEEALSDGADGNDGEAEACYTATCPSCQETVYFDESILEAGEVLCPNCGKRLEFELDADGPETDAPSDGHNGSEETPD